MISLELTNVMEGADWWRVTAGMAPDEISYQLVVDETTVPRSDSLTRLMALYARALIQAPTPEDGGLEPFQIIEVDDGIVLHSRKLEAPVPTSYPEVRSVLEPFLAQVFVRLDEESEADKRTEGLEFLSNELGVDAVQIYEDLLGEYC